MNHFSILHLIAPSDDLNFKFGLLILFMTLKNQIVLSY